MQKEALLVAEQIAKAKAEKILVEKRVYLLGKFDQSKNPDFILISPKYNMGLGTMYLRKEAYQAYLLMREAALVDGITLNIASATRNFNYQKELWEKKWNGITLVEGKKLPDSTPDGLTRFNKILEYSAAPGISRHHWGTDIDINGADVRYFNTEKGIKEYNWLTQNASLFGFCQTYKEKGGVRVSGYNEEKWHWSYMPLAKEFTSEYKKIISESSIIGFAGDEYVKGLNLIDNYVLAIDPECL